MSTYKRATGNIVFETLAANSSVSFIGPTANAVSVVINGDLSVSGNASLTGNIAGDRIFNGTTSIEIPVANGNANVSVGGVSNVLVVASNGINVAGNANVTGNAVIGNLQVNGVIAGNVSFGNLDTTGNVSITRDASLGQPTFRFNDTDTTLSVSTVLGAVEWFTSDTTPGARVTTAVRSIATSATGNARYEVLTSTNGAAATAKFVIDDVGNVGVANTAPLHTFAVSGNTYVSGTETVIGNITGGNFITAGLVSSTGNITSAANIAGGNLAITANVTANNLSATTGISVGVGGVTATGNIRGGNLVSDGVISATGNLTTTDIFATTLSASGNITGANLNVGGVANTNSVTAVTTVSAGGNVTGGNINTAGLVSATGNVTGGNISAPGRISAAGNVVTGAFFVGDGGFISNITIASNVAVTQLANGTSNWTIRGAGGNITGDIAGAANVVIITTDSMTVTGSISATGNVTGGNITTVGVVSATGNIGGGNVNATIGNFNTVIGVANASNLTTGTVPSDRLTGIYAINVSGYSATVSAAAQPNITSVGTLTSLIASGNITGGNLITAGSANVGTLIASSTASVTGNVTGGNIITGGLVTAAGNVNTSGGILATGNVTGGNLLTAGLISSTGAITGAAISGTTISGSGNVTGGNIITGGLISATGAITGAAISGTTISGSGNVTGGNVNTAGLVSATGNVTGGNINTAGLVSATGNVTGGNLITTGLISATGNVTGNYILGNGALLTGVITSVANINFGTSNVTVVSSGGNISVGVGGNSNVVVWATTGEYVTGLISASGNIQTGGQFIGNGAGLTSIPGANVTGTVPSATTAGTVTTAAQPNITSVGTLTSLSSSGNITGANINGNGSGLSSITGANVTGTVANATYATSAGSATTAGTVTANSQPNITSVGILSSLSVSGNITGGNLSVGIGTINVGNIVNTNANGVGNIGSATTYFNRVFATATTALYADLAEKFLADQPYKPGTVLVFGGDKEVTISVTDADHRVAGIVSTEPSYLMNSGLVGNYAVELALQGRVPCKVFGPVEKGDLLVSAADGHARAVKSASAGTIIGKSLQNFHGATGTIEIVVGRD
jgi:hypothetical protein